VRLFQSQHAQHYFDARRRPIFGEVSADFFEIDIAEQELASNKKGSARTSPSELPMVGTLLMPVINRFLVAYPQITLDLDFTDKLVNVIEDGFE